MTSVLTYCVKCRKKTRSKNIHVETASNGTKMQVGTCVICGTKKYTFLPNKQKGKGALDNFISALPFEAHLLVTDPKTGKPTKASFIGPGTKLDKY